MIAKKRFNLQLSDFTEVDIKNRTYPLIRHSAESDLTRALLTPISTIKSLIQKGQLVAFSVLTLKSAEKPLEIEDCYRFKLKYSLEPELHGSQFDMSDQVITLLDNLEILLNQVSLRSFLQVCKSFGFAT